MSGGTRAGVALATIGPGGRTSKADYAYAEIRKSIVDGRQEPGARLVIEQLARQLDVSVVPVREAIRRLEAEGFVTYIRNIGATVATIDLSRYAETVETLAILEAAATGLAAPMISKDDLRAARRVNTELRRSIKQLDPVRFTAKNHEFHEILYRRCPNGHLLAMVVDQWQLLAGIRRTGFSLVPERASGSVAEHDQLLELIERPAPVAEIEAFAREHRLRTVRRVLERIAAGAKPAPEDGQEPSSG